MANPLKFSRVSVFLAAVALMGVMATAGGAAEEDTIRAGVDSPGNQANGDSWSFSISADGRFVAFASEASNLVPDDTNASQDVFVRDRLAGTTELVSIGKGTAP